MREQEGCRRALVEAIEKFIPESKNQDWAINFVNCVEGISKEGFFCLMETLPQPLQRLMMKYWVIINAPEDYEMVINGVIK